MSKTGSDFSPEQWKFLSVFHAMGEPIALDVAGEVSPLLPSQLLDALERAQDIGLLEEIKNNVYGIGKQLPAKVQEQFSGINTEDRISSLLARLNRLGLMDQLSLDIHYNLICGSTRKKGGQLEIDLAQKFIGTHQPAKALLFYKKGLAGLTSKGGEAKENRGLIDHVLTFSDLTFSLGREFAVAHRFLEKAASAAEHLGDRRVRALIDLHLGRLFYIGNQRQKAVELMKQAEAVIKDLGDEDIRVRASEFLALYYYMQGRFAEAMTYFETGFTSFETRQEGHVVNPSAPIFYGHCAAYLGQFHKAIGNFDSAWRSAHRENNYGYAATLRASLGMILLLIKKEKESLLHLEGALEDAESHGNILGWYFAKGYLAYRQFLKGNYEKACTMFKTVVQKAKQSNIIYQLSSPWFLEMIFKMKHLGYAFLSEKEYLESIDRMINDPSVHIRGVMLRLIAQYPDSTDSRQIKAYLKKIKSTEPNMTKALLIQSETWLKSAGDPVQLAKTRIELARFALNAGNRQEAVNLAGKARKGLSGLWEEYFPDGIRALLETSPPPEKTPASHSTIDIHQLLLATADLVPSLEMTDFFHRMVATMNRLFCAEKGGLFWAEDRKTKSLSLASGRNLTQTEAGSPFFSNNMNGVRRCFKTEKPILIQSKNPNKKLNDYNAFSLLCIPLKLRGKTTGVLYYDNSYLNNSFGFLNESILERLADHLSLYIDRIEKIETLISNAKTSPLEAITSGASSPVQELLAESRQMTTILKKADQVAGSDSTVLVHGETGVGKELMARRLHQLSPRRNKAFIIIDATTIPENLVESELFGHEKGSFTGADRQKQGRIELAHQGTLFIDEIGEMPKPLQAKLLRVLQEKTFIRIGGSRPIHSDFRLVAATNRDLAAEVAKGDFREDLFYRISIVPIHVPPLRERKKDILILARHFLDRYKKRYHFSGLNLSPEDEARLVDYHWPGNVRELSNVIERGVILSSGDRLELVLKSRSAADMTHPFSDTPTMETLQRRYIEYILKETGGKISGPKGAAEILNMKRTTLYSRMEKLGISNKGK
jgi:transcriptional regulator with GAF, ATPase, and Fis domain